jgi:hypothetical protein
MHLRARHTVHTRPLAVASRARRLALLAARPDPKSGNDLSGLGGISEINEISEMPR